MKSVKRMLFLPFPLWLMGLFQMTWVCCVYLQRKIKFICIWLIVCLVNFICFQQNKNFYFFVYFPRSNYGSHKNGRFDVWLVQPRRFRPWSTCTRLNPGFLPHLKRWLHLKKKKYIYINVIDHTIHCHHYNT